MLPSFEVRRGRPRTEIAEVGSAQLRTGTRVVRHSPGEHGEGLAGMVGIDLLEHGLSHWLCPKSLVATRRPSANVVVSTPTGIV